MLTRRDFLKLSAASGAALALSNLVGSQKVFAAAGNGNSNGGQGNGNRGDRAIPLNRASHRR